MFDKGFKDNTRKSTEERSSLPTFDSPETVQTKNKIISFSDVFPSSEKNHKTIRSNNFLNLLNVSKNSNEQVKIYMKPDIPLIQVPKRRYGSLYSQ